MKPTTRLLSAALIAVLALTGAACAPEGKSGSNPVVRMSVGSYNLNNLPFFIADAKGYFKDEGVEVRTENFAQGGSKVLQALVAGSTDVAVGFYDHTIQMQPKKKDVVGFVVLSRNSGLVLAGRNDATFDHTRPDTIRGARIGITAPGSSSDFFVRYYLRRNNIPESAVSIIGVGSGAAAVAALEQKNIDLLVNYDPAATILADRKVGRILIDARSDEGAREVYGGIYPTAILYAQREFIEKNPDAIAGIVRAELRALRYIRDTPSEEIVASLPESYISGDRAIYVKAVERSKAIFSQDGLFNAPDLETTLRVLKAFNEDVAGTEIDLSRTYTNEFVTRAGGNSAPPGK
jgi:NitT/TauT family transport system substrate-binding protein